MISNAQAVRVLLLCADRPDADDDNLKIAAYESLNVVLATAPDSAIEPLTQVGPVV